ncbi:vacuolar protein sorting-associated protein 26B-like isoform X2 [Aethina tumida]|uniref:vacuolar protein sorting-associated protein 26B-like isoform X2 n=1 Tax=Aethina tumida TaxID=116153 RepID=UPI002147A4FA|nr:vacuolar protein sorting-associated protein 26B-like isoform X2 [Aethina tumida]
MSFFGFGQSAEIDVHLDGQDTRKTAEVKTEDGKKEKLYLYYDGETVAGKVNISLKKPGSKLEHQGIKIEFIGQIEMFYDRGNHHEFISLVKELARPGEMIAHTSYPFEFSCVEKPFEVYTGSNVRLRYFLRVTIIRRLADIVKEIDLAVHTLSSYPEMNNSIKMEVGIEDCLHIEFEYNKSKYHLKDVIVGKIYFLLVRIKIKHMEIAIIKRETTGSGPNVFTDNATIAKYEIMDGAPVRGESIPIRVFLAGYDLTPTMRDINKKFSVRYFLNLVLMDTEDRRYFKQQEITLWRKGDKLRKPNLQSPAIMAGTQNLENTSQLHQSQQQQQQQQKPDGGDNKNDVGEGEGGGAPVKEDFVRAPPSSQSNDRLNASANDPFDREAAAAEGASPTTASSSDSPPDPIQNMTREAGDGQNDNGTENAE